MPKTKQPCNKCNYKAVLFLFVGVIVVAVAVDVVDSVAVAVVDVAFV